MSHVFQRDAVVIIIIDLPELYEMDSDKNHNTVRRRGGRKG